MRADLMPQMIEAVDKWFAETGIVGLPNVGKSTCSTRSRRQSAAAENYPFCTSSRTSASWKSPIRASSSSTPSSSRKKKIPRRRVRRHRRLVKGASQGEGLGNQFSRTSAKSMRWCT